MKPCLKCIERKDNRRCEECRRKINLETNIWDDSNFGKAEENLSTKPKDAFGSTLKTDLIK